MASIPNNGYAAVMAGTNVYTGSNFYGSDCPKTPIVPTDPDDLCNRAFVLGAIPPIPPTPPVTEFSYTNTSNAVVPVGLPTAAGQKLNLLASGLIGGAWSNIGLPQGGLGEITAFTIASDGSYWFGTNVGTVNYILRTNAAITTVLGIASAGFTILPQNNPIITCFYEYAPYMFLGGRFDTLIDLSPSGGGNVENYNIGRYNIAGFTGFPQADQISGSGTGAAPNAYKGVDGIVNTIFVYNNDPSTPSSVFLMVGGVFQNTLPSAWAQPTGNLNNLIWVGSVLIAGGNQDFGNGSSGGFAVIGGGVSSIYGIPNDSFEIYVGGSFTQAGGGVNPYLPIPYLVKFNWQSGVVAPLPRGRPIPDLNGPITDMTLSSINGALMFITGNFDLSPYGGSTVTSYFLFNGQTTSPAVNNFPPGSQGGKVFCNGGRDAVLYRATNIIAWNNTAGNYWNKIVANSGAGDLSGFRFQTGSANPSYYASYNANGFLLRFDPGASPPVATFQLPSARFRSATAPTNQYQNAVFSTAAGAQVFLSGAELYWSPAGALTTGLTFT